MAKSERKFSKKLALTVAIPAVVMIVIIAVLGVSFAWFSDSVTAQIATINMSVADIFVMEFVISEDTQVYDPDNNLSYIYEGQTAFDSSGLLITDTHATEKGLVGAQRVSYMNDRAFIAPFNLRLDTDGWTVAFTAKISNVSITNTTVGEDGEVTHKVAPITIPTPTTDADSQDAVTLTEEDVKLGFTWYIKDSFNRLYTPYGTMNNIVPTTSATVTPALNVNNWEVPILNSGFVAAFDGGEDEYNYSFNIVFAPEILYWQQYGSTDVYNQTAQDIYGDSSVDGGFKSTKWNAINKYSSQVYSGSTYRFTVVLTVDSAVKGE